MEFVNGEDIESFTKQNPEKLDSLFLQAISGFSYLEGQSILHRDIRPLNILVCTDGTLKIIDLGFGKHIVEDGDFDKSITLNWWCDTPAEFGEGKYDFTTEVYFVGKLFEKLISDNNISHFKYKETLGRMCKYSQKERLRSFVEVEKEIIKNDSLI